MKPSLAEELIELWRAVKERPAVAFLTIYTITTIAFTVLWILSNL